MFRCIVVSIAHSNFSLFYKNPSLVYTHSRGERVAEYRRHDGPSDPTGGLRSSHIAFDTRGESPARSQAEELNAGMPEERLRVYGGGGRKMWRIQAVTFPFDGGRWEDDERRRDRHGFWGRLGSFSCGGPSGCLGPVGGVELPRGRGATRLGRGQRFILGRNAARQQAQLKLMFPLFFFRVFSLSLSLL
jgi:hypothetical protein